MLNVEFYIYTCIYISSTNTKSHTKPFTKLINKQFIWKCTHCCPPPAATRSQNVPINGNPFGLGNFRISSADFSAFAFHGQAPMLGDDNCCVAVMLLGFVVAVIEMVSAVDGVKYSPSRRRYLCVLPHITSRRNQKARKAFNTTDGNKFSIVTMRTFVSNSSGNCNFLQALTQHCARCLLAWRKPGYITTNRTSIFCCWCALLLLMMLPMCVVWLYGLLAYYKCCFGKNLIFFYWFLLFFLIYGFLLISLLLLMMCIGFCRLLFSYDYLKKKNILKKIITRNRQFWDRA